MSVKLSKSESKILGEIYSSSEAMDNLTVLCDEFGGRFVGTPENRAAAEFVLGKFEEYGFENPHLEAFKTPGCRVGSSSLEIVKPVQEVPCLTLPMTASGEAEAEVVFVDEAYRFDGVHVELDVSSIPSRCNMMPLIIPIRTWYVVPFPAECCPISEVDVETAICSGIPEEEVVA